MDKLLQWSIAQQSGDTEAMEKIGQPDPEMLAQLFGAKVDEPTLMKQGMAVITNPEATLDNKLVAFDNFEMLIENMDNANNIENLKLWPHIIHQLNKNNDESLQIMAALVVGIAVQNNPKSQEDFNKYQDGLARLIEIASDESSSKALVHKSLFAMASFIRNFEPAYASFNSQNGWSTIRDLSSVDNKSVLRYLSLLSAILSTGLDSEKHSHVRSIKLIDNLISVLNSKEPNVSCVDKVLNVITQLAQLNYDFSKEEVVKLASGLDNIEPLKNEISLDDYNSARQVANHSV